MNAVELLKKLDVERDAYLATLGQVHEALAKAIIAGDGHVPATPVQSPRSAFDRASRRSLGESERKGSLNGVSTFKGSIISGDDDDVSDDDEALYVQELLPISSFDDEHLRTYLRTNGWNEASKLMLEPIVTNSGRLKYPTLFPAEPGTEDDASRSSLYQVFEIGTDGSTLPLTADPTGRKLPKGQVMWNHIKAINVDRNRQRQAVGRITILREPSPTLFGAIHMTMNGLFDMDEIFSRLVQQGTTMAYMTRAYSDDARKRRTFIFSFEYFTILGDDCEPMPWQQSDHERNRPTEHIAISRCSSIVALALVGEPVKKVKNPARRAKTQHGYIYSPWGPWHVLNIQCYPDWKSTTDSHDSTKHYVNGPEAFLNTLLVEYKDAQARFEDISRRVTKLITPPPDFMFNGELRDKLLFEDAEFTYSRRYFWAFQTLGTVNQSIKAMVDAYEDTLTDDVWDGRHKTLWPLVDDDSARNAYWRRRMASLKRDFESEISALKIIIEENDDRRKEIRNLRDNLFSGTSVLESRKSVEQTEITVQQGHNIKLLTLVNMLFLPLQFVTGVFGMTAMPTDGSYWRFGVVLTTVCIPFFLLIGSMNTTRGMIFWKDQVGSWILKIGRIFWWMSTKDGRSKNNERRDSASSDSSNELALKSMGRSQSSVEAIARRRGPSPPVERDQEPERSPEKRRSISFGQPLIMSPDPQVGLMGTPTDSFQRSQILHNNIRPIEEEPLQVPQPAMITAPSYSKANSAEAEIEIAAQPGRAGSKTTNGTAGRSRFWAILRAGKRRGQDAGEVVV